MPRDPTRQRIFVSYARCDGEGFARELREKLAGLSFSLWHDRQDLEGGRDWWRQITEAIDAAEYLLLVMTPGALRSDTVRREWRYARQQGRCVVPIVEGEPLDVSGLPRWMADTQRYDFKIPEHRERLVEHLKRPCEVPRVPMMAPPPPTDFVARPKEFAALKAALLDERGEPVAIASALKGAGGYGKTTLAKALCADGDILDAYHDGVLWVTLGERPGDPQGRIEDLIHVLRGARESFATRDATLARLGEILADRRCLLVIDDVWHRGDAEPFLRVGPSCARLLTTRDSATLPDEARDLRVDALQTDQAVELLQTGLPAGDPARLRTLAARLGEWPLLLKLANGALRERVNRLRAPLPDALAHVERLLDKRGLSAFDAGNARSREEAIGITLGLSLDVVGEAERARLSELAVFPEDLDIPLPAIELLWKQTAGIDGDDTEDTLRRLFALSLLLDLDLTDRTARLHDVIRAWLRQQLGGDSPLALDRALVAGYRELCAGTWHELPDDGYAFRHLPGHLSAIDEGAWRALLLDPRWMARKLETVRPAVLISDYETSTDEGIRLIGDSLRLSAHVLAHDSAQLPGQLCGRLAAIGQSACQHIVAAARANRHRVALVPRFASLRVPGGPLLRTFLGHRGCVRSVALTTTGRQAVSASDDGTVRLWDLASGDELDRLEGHDGGASLVMVTPDGRHVLSAGDDGTLRLWDLARRTALCRLEGHKGEVQALAVTSDGLHAFSAGVDLTLRYWDLARGAELCRLEGLKSAVRAIAVTPDGGQAILADDAYALRLWDVASSTELSCLGSNEYGVQAIAAMPDGRHVIFACNDYPLRMWDLVSATEVHQLKGHEDWVRAVALTQDGQRAVSAGDDHTVRLWDLSNGAELRCFEGHEGWVWAVAVTPDGRFAVSGGEDCTLRLWDLTRGPQPQHAEGHEGRVWAIAVAQDIQHAVSGGDDGILRVWQLAGGAELHRLEGPNRRVLSVAVTPDGRTAVSASGDGTLRHWDLASGVELRRMEGLGMWVWALAITQNGRHAVSGGDDRALRLWDLKSGNELRRMDGHEAAVRSVALVPGKWQAISASDDSTVRLWDLATGIELRVLEGHEDWVRSIAVTSDGRYALSAGDDGTLRLWDLESGAELRRMEGFQGRIWSVTVAADGRHAMSAGSDRTLRLWDLESGEAVATFTGDGVMHAVAAASERLFIAGDAGGAIHIMEVVGPSF